jgi:hypothetical protein
MRAVGKTRDPEMKMGHMRLAEEQNQEIRTWQAERDSIEGEMDRELADAYAVRTAISQLNSQTVRLLRMDAKERRRLAESLGVRVIVYRDSHKPWFLLVSDLPGLMAGWDARRHRHAPIEPVRMSDEELASLMATWIPDEPAHVSYRDAVLEWTAPVPTQLNGQVKRAAAQGEATRPELEGAKV